MNPQGLNLIQATAWYPPYDMGGTEAYLEGLVDSLEARGIRSHLIVPRHPNAGSNYVHRGMEVTTYPVDAVPSAKEIKCNVEHQGFDAFYAWLKSQKRGIYHQHSWTRGCGPHHLRAARTLGFKTVLTVHVPGNICLRGTMMRYGVLACDGLVVPGVCGACWAHGRGLPSSVARGVAALPDVFADWVKSRFGRIGTMLSARALAREKARQVQAMAVDADIIVAVCQWLYDALLQNGIPKSKLRLSRQGIAGSFAKRARAAAQNAPSTMPETLRILYLGRWDPVKGIDIAVNAIRTLPANISVTLTIKAIPDPANGGSFEQRVRQNAGRDSRITIEPPVSRSALPEILASYDVLIVPSRWLETGPMVVLEALAAGLYVLGSNLGGIKELVTSDKCGELLDTSDPIAWSASIERLAAKKRAGKLSTLPADVRSIDEAASEMAAVYSHLCPIERV